MSACASARMNLFGMSLAMTEPPDLVDLYLELALSGAKADDPRLVALMAAMSPEQLERGKEAIGELLLRHEPLPAKPN
jgi:hypothetical protein